MERVISKRIHGMAKKSSWIRKMFEEGEQLKKKLGRERVFDFTLGNPTAEPPEEVRTALAKLASENSNGAHRYMANAGYEEVRGKVAKSIESRTNIGFEAKNIIMTVGAGGALNVIIKALCDPEDEIIVTAPYFPEYFFYADNHQAKVVVTQTDENFQIVPENIERAITKSTRILILNSPNNPTGAVYSERLLKEVGEILEQASQKNGHPIYLVMDEPYRKLTYEGVVVPEVFNCYKRTIVATSHSKDLGLPGERIGYIAINPENDGADKIIGAMTMANRILGFVNAPAIFQRLVSQFQDFEPDMSGYETNRKILLDGLLDIGYEVVNPDGGFYLFPKSPVKDDLYFVKRLKEKKVLVAPGIGFGRAEHFRIAFCCDSSTCEKSLLAFREVFECEN